MKKIILCSSNPILIKNLYGMLRDEGHSVETTEHPAFAIQKVMSSAYDLILIDSEPFGLSAEDATQIIKTIIPDMPIVFIGSDQNQMTLESPVNLEEIKRTVHSIAVY